MNSACKINVNESFYAFFYALCILYISECLECSNLFSFNLHHDQPVEENAEISVKNTLTTYKYVLRYKV